MLRLHPTVIHLTPSEVHDFTASEPVDFDVSIVNDICAEPRDDEKSQVGDEIAAKERAPSTEVSIDLGIIQSHARLASPLQLASAAQTSLILTRQSSKRHHVRHVLDEGQSEPNRAPRRHWARQGEHLVVGTEGDAAGEAALGDVIRATQRLNVLEDFIRHQKACFFLKGRGLLQQLSDDVVRVWNPQPGWTVQESKGSTAA
ncbi:hypothetical protein CMUS01_06901 [Colletotrichum musicola]|uniref:Uncharacterized protein n=1 Tax=Colletotrichum musicola TaxID=2175873 RepID=A0A8H6NHD0_9PEZI|nr:hypothetical protein CMUS01_06901 [Colletotrichum musicola]